MNWYIKCFKQYADFSSRARRTEYWMFTLFNFIASLIVGLIGAAVGEWICYVYSLAILIPSLAVSVRRLHDIGKNGWWILINLIPLIGQIWFIVLAVTDSQPGSNEWGENPKGM